MCIPAVHVCSDDTRSLVSWTIWTSLLAESAEVRLPPFPHCFSVSPYFTNHDIDRVPTSNTRIHNGTCNVQDEGAAELPI